MLSLDHNIIWTIVNILVLFLFLKKFLFKPVTEMMEKRTQTIASSLQDAENSKTEALQLKADYEEQLSHAKDEASLIMKEARDRAAREYSEQMKESKQAAALMMQDAGKVIELERQKSVKEAQAEIATIALLAASKVIEKNVDDATNKKMLTSFLHEVGAAK